MTGPPDSVALHQSAKQSSLFTSDWRSGHRFALFWLALGLCLLSLVALAVVLFGWGDTMTYGDFTVVLFYAVPAAIVFAIASLLLWAGLRTRYVLTFTAFCLVGLTAFIVYVLVERAL